MPIPKEHVHITFLTPWIVLVGILGFQSRSKHYEKPCTYLQYYFSCLAFLRCQGKFCPSTKNGINWRWNIILVNFGPTHTAAPQKMVVFTDFIIPSSCFVATTFSVSSYTLVCLF